MPYDADTAIAAVASAAGGAARGVIRVSGSDVLAKLATCYVPLEPGESLAHMRAPRRLSGLIRLHSDRPGKQSAVPGELFVWPSSRSYTRQPSAEFHTFGSPPLLAAVMEQLALAGIRPAEPGEFTLRAFLAGRIDLTQAEAVLGVVDARSRRDLDAALDQLAGGLSRPLHRVRHDLLDLLAEVEAGLDFIEEDIEFISRGVLQERLAAAQELVDDALRQIMVRDVCAEAARVVITGRPNAGKSSLFNALVQRYGAGTPPTAIVSDAPGATRDFLSARLIIIGIACELVDTAGLEEGILHDDVQLAAQRLTGVQRRAADLQLYCVDATADPLCEPFNSANMGDGDLLVLTKIDALRAGDRMEMPHRVPASFAVCSSVTGQGIEQLAAHLAARLCEVGAGPSSAVSAERCAGSLREAARALAGAVTAADAASNELIAAEIRAALDAIGEVVGAVCADDVLDRIFGQFCIGK